jgi:hypothetical protein
VSRNEWVFRGQGVTRVRRRMEVSVITKVENTKMSVGAIS